MSRPYSCTRRSIHSDGSSFDHARPGKYLALDCEMVGVGPEGKESSLARASLVNYHGAIQLDVFVRQRERVVDYRTEFSGVRPKDMIDGEPSDVFICRRISEALHLARPFAEVQKQIAELLKDRILVGHAVHNDLKVFRAIHISTPSLLTTSCCSGSTSLTSTTPHPRYPDLRT